MKYDDHPLDGVSILKEPSEPYFFRKPNEIFPFCNDILTLQQEAFFTITVNSKHRVISRRLISFGILDATLVHSREVFRYAILNNAKSIHLVHNHPSGDTMPSNEDLRITRQLIEAGKVLDISVIDHLIIGKEGYEAKVYSIRENCAVSFV